MCCGNCTKFLIFTMRISDDNMAPSPGQDYIWIPLSV